MKIAAIFQPGMVLQRGKPVLIWGTGTPREKIRGAIQGKTAAAVTGSDGKWMLRIPELRESAGEVLTVESGSQRIEINDIAVGEVFVAAGQSNMEFWMRYEKHYQEMIPICENPDVRFYDMPKLAYEGQECDFDYHNVGIWRKASKENLAYFSAVGYYLARKLEKELSVPVGIIGCSWGGTRSLAWMSEEHAREIQKEQTADFEAALKGRSCEDFRKDCAGNPMNDTGNHEWIPFNDFILPNTPTEEEISAYLSQNRCPEADPAKPQDAPGALYRHMVLRLAPYTVRAVLWYQGESDDEIDGAQKNYQAALDAVKRDWRSAWSDPVLPFFVVQLPGFCSWFGFVNKGFAVIRACQQQAVDEDANAWLCSISDAGEEFDIHPKDKKIVGERLALLAEKHLFGENVLADAPRVKDIERGENTIALQFEYAEGGLLVDGENVNALEVLRDGREVSFTAVISGSRLIIHTPPDASENLTIKFACQAWYRVNLFNQNHIPAIPFQVSLSCKRGINHE